MAKKLNGDAAVIVERIDNLKEYVSEVFKENKEDHRHIFKVLSKHGNTISYLKAYAYIATGIAGTITYIIIRMNMGG